ncbi:glycosyltransferase involved in cell wall biosynthesis [Mucilaginibacter gracilis]|uniref:Glycosyltransferase involved in cell wall biosynthesis n=1 Tax=Mucilaginibacter gracilis TaxID=423350 RepID=A0A495IZ09_9SPHI|nr:glycosyltransferase family 4 protein [Mucilaginibacter gracilis]RKR81917.1 glycosyltransferase involved in cell wall biosynthesis [Mucilaginibacter gracilis]
MKNIIAVQMLSSKSQSFGVFKQSVAALVNTGFNVKTITTASQAAQLSDLKGVDALILKNNDEFNPSPSIYAIFKTQIKLFFKIIKMAQPGDVVYINSIYSVMPGFAAKIKKAKLIWHIDNAKQQPRLFSLFLKHVINKTANQVIFASAASKDQLGLKNNQKQAIIYNTPTTEFIQQSAQLRNTNPTKKFTALMISASHAKQSINNYFELACRMPLIDFELLLTDTTENALSYMLSSARPANLNVFIEDNNRPEFYKRANIFINPSPASEHSASADVNVLEAMYFGMPVIVPTAGGLKELISTGKHGLVVDGADITTIEKALLELKTNQSLYNRVSAACLKQATLFNPALFSLQFTNLFKGERAQPYANLIQLFGNSYLNKEISVFNTNLA